MKIFKKGCKVEKTLNACYRGRSLMWDVTVVDTFALSHCVRAIQMADHGPNLTNLNLGW